VPDASALKRLRAGICLRSGVRLASSKIIPIKEGNNTWLEVTLTEGKNRQIRDMFDETGHPVMKLRRTRIGFLNDEGLKPGQYRFLKAHEVARIFRIGAKAGLVPSG
jgi:pseudouridine synthase